MLSRICLAAVSTRLRSIATPSLVRGAVVAALLVPPVLLYADTSFTGWRSASGDGQIEYRWRNYIGGFRQSGCHVEFRNLDGNDHHQYKAMIDAFDVTNKDHTERADIMFYEKGETRSADEEPCDRVTGVLMVAR